ncbi:MAG: ABC transporter substrate-binding protein [Candidatus Ancillula sp.]|jgi:D-methionine transport system substrate-binding protein|nr:ABC transporter substrate-binding protein [Candidatus Ancillula sp.]
MVGIVKKIRKGLGIALSVTLVGVFSIAVSACGKSNNSAEKGTKDNPVVLGVVKASDSQWDILKTDLEKDGIYIELKNFTDYTSENPATVRGELDINAFQHLDYLAGYNNDSHETLVPIGAKAIFPIGFYANPNGSVKAVSDIHEGAHIVVPNDETNGNRALLLLEELGLIKLTNKKGTYSTVQDIDKTSKVKVTAVDPAQTAHSLSDPSIVAAVINNDYTKDIGLKTTDAIAREKSDGDFVKRYTNVWVTRKADAEKEIYKKIVKHASEDKKYLDAVQADSSGTAVIVTKYTAKELQDILQKLQDEKKANA